MNFQRENLFTVLSHEVGEYRHHFEPLLAVMERRSDQLTVEDVFLQASRGEAQIWGYAVDGNVRAVAVTKIHQMVKGPLCTIWIVVGFDVMGIFEGAHSEIEAWARSKGCYAMESVGRRGWGKVLSGYEQKAVVFEKTLSKVH